jgi:hypothetical protein
MSVSVDLQILVSGLILNIKNNSNTGCGKNYVVSFTFLISTLMVGLTR